MPFVVGCELSASGRKLYAQPFVVGTWHTQNVADPEKSAWTMFLEQLGSRPDIRSRDRIAVIVDHDLDSLDAYNSRTRPISGDFFLPENVDLVYASEKGTEFLGAKLIRLCDQEAAKELKRRLHDTSDSPAD